MKKILAIMMMLALLVLGQVPKIDAVQSPRAFEGQMWASTLALYGTLKDQTHFLCTTEPIEKTADGYLLLSAGHCVQDNPVEVKYSVTDEIGGKLTPVTLVKAREDGSLDFSLWNFKTTKNYTVMKLGDEKDLYIGDAIINPNFSLGVGKQLSHGYVASQPLQATSETADIIVPGDFIVQEEAAPGASGSPIISVRTRKVVGLLVAQFDANIGFMIEPISSFAKFMAEPTQPHPASPTGIVIPEDEFAANFGQAHPFTLTAHGADPKFTQAGYNFRVETDGFELSDDYYYNVPVFIDKPDEGEKGYRLVSTKDGYSVSVFAVSKTNGTTR